MILTSDESVDIFTRLQIAMGALDRIGKLIDNTGPWNAELGLQQVRGIVLNAQDMIESPVMYGDDE